VEEEQNKKDNPKENFYEFLKLFRKQKEKRFSSSRMIYNISPEMLKKN